VANYSIKSNSHHEVRLYIGSREHYNGQRFGRDELIAAVTEFQRQNTLELAGPLRFTPTCYVWDDYIEDGWEIAIINYPRYPKPEAVLNSFMLRLADYLLYRFRQNRISVVFPNEIVMLQSHDAQERS